MYSTPRWPEAIAHRGLHVTAPENSLPAFEAAIAAGAHGIELDVHASADESLFVHHDATLLIGETQQPIARLESSEIVRYTLSGGESIPTLDAALDVIAARAVVYIEIKARGIETAVTRCLRRHFDNAQRYAIHAFDHRSAKRMLELVPSVRTGVLQVSYLLDSCAALRAAGASDLWQHAEFIDEALVTSVHACGGRVIAWTANTESDWSRLSACAVDAICTDRVDLYLGWVQNQSEGGEPSA